MTESPKLLPCPWCGDSRTTVRAGIFIHPPFDRYRAVCGTDGCCSKTEWHASKAGAADAWNKRAPDPEREAMAKVCEAAQALIDQQREMPWYGCEIILRDALADLERARKADV